MTALEVYTQMAKPLTEQERLRVATMILSEIAPTPSPFDNPGYSDEWTEEDMREFTADSLRRFDGREANEAG